MDIRSSKGEIGILGIKAQFNWEIWNLKVNLDLIAESIVAGAAIHRSTIVT